MKFSLSAEQREFGASVRELLAASDVPAAIRAWGSGDSGPGRKLWERLAEAGVLALALPEAHGGFGANSVDLAVAFEELGRFAVPGPLVESVAVLPRLLVGTADADVLTGIGSGESMATVAMPPDVPFAVDAATADHAYLLADDDLTRADVVAEVPSVDAARHLAELQAVDKFAEVDGSRAYDVGVLATAAQLLGLGHALLDRGADYAKQRVQFGRPIGEFQAIKHQLADVLVALEFARPLLYAAALAVDQNAATVARDVSAAKIACADAAYRAARTSLQVHGAIGYTAEYDLALWLTKVRALTFAWGTRASHRRRVLAAL
jgi:alkylation response protein AidB-like acyl-CoA dehydrogenase